MKLTFSFHKWITPLHVRELTEVETAQMLFAGANWWGMEGDYDVQAVLRNLDEGAEYDKKVDHSYRSQKAIGNSDKAADDVAKKPPTE